MEKMMNDEFLCTCGSKLFIDFRPFTIDYSTFMVWSLKENLKPAKLTIPVIQCVACGRIHVPKASFQGKNILDAEVQLYAELLKYVETRNSLISLLSDLNNRINVIERLQKDSVVNNGVIETAFASKENPKDDAPKSGAGKRSGKNNGNKTA